MAAADSTEHQSDATYLDLSCSSYMYVPGDVIEKFSNVTSVNLRCNRLASFPPLRGAPITQITILNLSNNRFSGSAPVSVFQQLPALVTLDLSWNEITSLPPEITLVKETLRHLHLHHNKISSIPKEFSSLVQLEFLDLFSNLLNDLTEDIFTGFGQLHHLDLGSNNLTKLPTSLFDSCPSLAVLRVYRNHISSFDAFPSAPRLESLRVLELRWNKLEHTPRALLSACANSLQHLDLSGNTLFSFSIDQPLPRLTKLNLFANKLSSFPAPEDWPRLFPSLRVLLLHKNSSLDAAIVESSNTLTEKFSQACAPYSCRPLPESTPQPSVADPASSSPMSPDDVADRVRGCLYGHVIGDALGVGSEFLTHSQALYYYGGEPLSTTAIVRDAHRASFERGDWTDDGDQQILLMEALLEEAPSSAPLPSKYDAKYTQRPRKRRGVPLVFAEKLKHWISYGFAELNDTAAVGAGMSTRAVVHHERFLEEPEETARMFWEKSDRTAAANGGVMRSAVCGLVDLSTTGSPHLNTVIDLARSTCRVTHYDPRCVASAIFVATLVATLVHGKIPKPHTVDNVLKTLGRIAVQKAAEGIDRVDTEALQQEFDRHISAPSLASLDLDSSEAMGYTLKPVGCAAWALRVYCRARGHREHAVDTAEDAKLFREIVTEIILRGGDADTNACVAAALIGAAIGESALPRDWLDGLINRPWLEPKIADFVAMVTKPLRAPAGTTAGLPPNEAEMLARRRARYHCGDRYITMAQIEPWSATLQRLAGEGRILRLPSEGEYENSSQVRDEWQQRGIRTVVELKALTNIRHDAELNEKVSLIQADSTCLEIDAIVNAANTSLLGGGGIDGAIHEAAGPGLLRETSTLGGCPTGHAKITNGYDLPAKRVIHAVGPIGENPTALRSAYESCLRLVLEHNIRTVGFCCISTGIYAYPLAPATHIALGTIRRWLETDDNRHRVYRIILVVYLKRELDMYQQLMPLYFPPKPTESSQGSNNQFNTAFVPATSETSSSANTENSQAASVGFTPAAGSEKAA